MADINLGITSSEVSCHYLQTYLTLLSVCAECKLQAFINPDELSKRLMSDLNICPLWLKADTLMCVCA